MNEYLKHVLSSHTSTYPLRDYADILDSVCDLIEKIDDGHLDAKKGADFLIEVLTLYRDNIKD